MAAEVETLRNWIAGEWSAPRGTDAAEVTNPASGGVVAEAPMSSVEDVADAVQAAHDAFDGWRATPAVDRARLIFRLQALVEQHFEDLSRTITVENGKTLEEARGELLRTLENIEVAAGIPTLQLGDFSADIASGIDEYSVREPLGVFAQIGPFNFPSMVPFWFAPYALATGNTYVIKPSPQTPLSQARMMDLIAQAGFPAGVVNLVHGGAETAEALIADPRVRGVSFVGTTPVARRIYELAAIHGKRVQAQGGAKNHLIVLPDANLDAAIPNLMGSTFGCAGQRCLAGSVVVAANEVYAEFRDRLQAAAQALRLGDGLDPQADMGPVISQDSRDRILATIDDAASAGARLVADGRGATAEGLPNGFWVGATVVDEVTPDMRISQEEVFGPVASLQRVGTLRGGDGHDRGQPVRQRRFDLHQQRRGGPGVRFRRQHWKRGRQRGRGRPDGLLPVRRAQAVVLWGSARTGRRRRAVLYRSESRRLTLAALDRRPRPLGLSRPCPLADAKTPTAPRATGPIFRTFIRRSPLYRLGSSERPSRITSRLRSGSRRVCWLPSCAPAAPERPWKSARTLATPRPGSPVLFRPTVA